MRVWNPDANERDHAVLEWGWTRPKLRADLRFHFHQDRDQPIYVIEDRVNRRCLQVGLPEYRFLRRLDGRKTASKLVGEAAIYGENARDEDKTASLLRWALDQQLLVSDEGLQADRRREQLASCQRLTKKKGLMKLFFPKFSLGSPDRFLRIATVLFGWFFTPVVFLLWLGLLGWACFLAADNWEELSRTGGQVVVPTNWLWLILIGIALKVIHEAFHGIATYRFGGIVPEWGIQLIAFITPLTYVDATSSWAFSSRWKRIAVAGAGMYIELFIAAIAMILWTRLDTGAARTITFNVLFVASFITLLFNANPLMRFDGYYILSDYFQIRNLGTRSQQLLRWIWTKLFLGSKNIQMPQGTRKHFSWLLLYGVLALVWRMIILIGILAIITHFFKGAGVVLVAAVLIGASASMITKAYKQLSDPAVRGRVNWRAATLRIGVTAAAVGLSFYFVKIGTARAAVAVVEYPDKFAIRAEASGFVRKVHCRHGEKVKAGDLLVSLENRLLANDTEGLKLDLASSRQKAAIFFDEGRIAEWQAEEELIGGFQDQLETLTERRHSLNLVSPIAGTVDGVALENLIGTYLETGTRVLTVIPDAQPGLLISMRQEDFRRLREEDLLNEPKFEIRFPGRSQAVTAEVTRIETKATTAIPHPGLSSTHGGPLTVRAIDGSQTGRGDGVARKGRATDSQTHFTGLRPEEENAMHELVQPRMTLYATLRQVDSDAFREGEWGRARPQSLPSQRLGSWIYQRSARYLRGQFRLDSRI